VPSYNTSFPYIEFGRYCDVVLPQDYWYDQFSGSGGVTPEYMTTLMNSDWIHWQGVWAGEGDSSSIKPLAPIGQGFQGASPSPIPGSQLTRFMWCLKTNSPCATAGGIRGISFWVGDQHTTDDWNAIQSINIGNVFRIDSYAGNDNNGNAQVFLPDAANRMASDWQGSINGSWVGWSSFGTLTTANTPAVGYNADGRMQLFVRDANGTVWSIWKTGINGAWNTWQNYGGNIVGTITVGYLPSGAMQIFGRSPGNTVQTMNQTGPNAGWTGWSDMGGSCYGDPTVAPNADGRMQLFCRNSANTMATTWKTGLTENASWSSWSTLNISTYGKPCAGLLSDGTMQVFTRSSANTVQSIWQTGPNAGWGTASDMGGSCYSDPVLAYGANGTFHLLIRTASNTVSHNAKADNQGGVWSGWVDMGGNCTGFLTAGYNADGRIQIFVRDANYNLQSTWQTAVNGSTWNGWLNLGGNTPAVTITTQPSSQTVNIGQNATFSVVANNVLSYQWTFGGANISGATASTYTINNAQPGNAGNYNVVVGNNAGTLASANATLTVTGATPPSITTQPASQTVNQGQSATFSVVDSGTAPLSYQWRFNGANLSGATASSYTVNNAQAGNAGSYSVVVANVAGNVTSANATLTVILPPVISQQPASQLAAVSNSVTFTVGLSQGTSPAYQWRYNGTPIAGATQSSLTVIGLTWNSGGSYSVVVTNVAGSVTSANAVLTMEQAVFSWTDGFEGYAVGVLDKNQSGGPNTGASNPWWGPAPPNISVFTNQSGVTPHSGSKMIGATAGYQFCQEYLNLPYRMDAGQTYYGNLMLDWWFYDPKGTGVGATNYGDYFALAQYAPVSLTNDFFTTSFTAWNQRMSLGAYVGTGQNVGVYQARIVGATGGFNANGWFNTATPRSVGWHHARVVLGIPTGNSAAVQMFIDNMSTPTFSYANSGLNVGFNLIEINASFGGINTGGYFDDLTFRAANDPWIAQQPSSLTVAAGQNATFATVAVGTSYQWQFNSSNISGATASSYTVTNAQSGNAGTYTCVVTGANGTVTTSPATLTVH
jgi:hypothetical protein